MTSKIQYIRTQLNMPLLQYNFVSDKTIPSLREKLEEGKRFVNKLHFYGFNRLRYGLYLFDQSTETIRVFNIMGGRNKDWYAFYIDVPYSVLDIVCLHQHTRHFIIEDLRLCILTGKYYM